uniref:Uncharacterized protein n=1 Tax=Arundo donax TaxID=35708 RepID=A0A0A9FEV2_ARUDO
MRTSCRTGLGSTASGGSGEGERRAGERIGPRAQQGGDDWCTDARRRSKRKRMRVCAGQPDPVRRRLGRPCQSLLLNPAAAIEGAQAEPPSRHGAAAIAPFRPLRPVTLRTPPPSYRVRPKRGAARKTVTQEGAVPRR